MNSQSLEIPCVLMRGGTSKGLYFLKSDLPEDTKDRDRVLLSLMGSPDPRQIDGLGGAHPLTSKVAIISKSKRDGVDVDYLFLQVKVDKAEVSDGQNCGNILAGVGSFAIENGLVEADENETEVCIHMVNSGAIAVATIKTPNKKVSYEGDEMIDGVPGCAAAVLLEFKKIEGSSCGSLLPTGNLIDEIDKIDVTCIDNGMPVVIIEAVKLGLTGCERPSNLESNTFLKNRLESIRLKAGRMMNLGDVTDKTVPKMTLVAPPQYGGIISTRSFIPQRVHEAIGVLGAASVAVACLLPGSVANKIIKCTTFKKSTPLVIEHPTGSFSVEIDVVNENGEFKVNRSALLRTARKLMQGTAFVSLSKLSY